MTFAGPNETPGATSQAKPLQILYYALARILFLQVSEYLDGAVVRFADLQSTAEAKLPFQSRRYEGLSESLWSRQLNPL
jgi:hypothetical protein